MHVINESLAHSKAAELVKAVTSLAHDLNERESDIDDLSRAAVMAGAHQVDPIYVDWDTLVAGDYPMEDPDIPAAFAQITSLDRAVISLSGDAPFSGIVAWQPPEDWAPEMDGPVLLLQAWFGTPLEPMPAGIIGSNRQTHWVPNDAIDEAMMKQILDGMSTILLAMSHEGHTLTPAKPSRQIRRSTALPADVTVNVWRPPTI